MKNRKPKTNDLRILLRVAIVTVFLIFVAVLTTPAATNNASTHKETTSPPAHKSNYFDSASTQTFNSKKTLGQSLVGSQNNLKDFHHNTDAKLTKLAKETPLAVSLLDLASGEELISFNATKTFTAASTYKIYAVTSLIQQLENGQLSDSQYLDGLPVWQCIHNTITYSDNDCIEAWLTSENFEASQATVDDAGLRNTSFKPFDIRTTAADLTSFLSSLSHGDLLNESHTQELISLMEEQIWREGIPAGWSDGAAIANKPGFLEYVHHDAALITEEEQVLALAVMTESSDFTLTQKATQIIFEEANMLLNQ